jgi:hypothetical protein
MEDKINIIKNYVKLISPLPCDEVVIDFVTVWNLYVVNIYVDTYDESNQYNSSDGNQKTIKDEIIQELKSMFPYNFRVFIRVNMFNKPFNLLRRYD